MMNRTGRFGYAEADGLQMLQLPYAGGDLAMVILLPRPSVGIESLQEQMEPEALNRWLGRIGSRRVKVSIPRFKMTSQFALGPVLAAMGMPDAFSTAADFSGMTGDRDLLISAVIHKAFVEVNEEGTEAAAATGVAMQLTMARPQGPIVFRADRPFLFLIRDHRSGLVLFLGRVLDPAAE